MITSEIQVGLKLERREVCLKWNSTADCLRNESQPDVCVVSNGLSPLVRLAWDDYVFGGVKSQVTTEFGGESYNGNTLRSFRLTIRHIGNIDSLSGEFHWLQDRLAKLFGMTLLCIDDGERGRSVWKSGSVVIRHEYFNGIGGGHAVYLFQPVGIWDGGLLESG